MRGPPPARCAASNDIPRPEPKTPQVLTCPVLPVSDALDILPKLAWAANSPAGLQTSAKLQVTHRTRVGFEFPQIKWQLRVKCARKRPQTCENAALNSQSMPKMNRVGSQTSI